MGTRNGDRFREAGAVFLYTILAMIVILFIANFPELNSFISGWLKEH